MTVPSLNIPSNLYSICLNIPEGNEGLSTIEASSRGIYLVNDRPLWFEQPRPVHTFLMGSAVSAPIERKVKALRGRRYMRGMRPEKYFEVVVKKEHGELLDILGFSDDEAFTIFVQVFY